MAEKKMSIIIPAYNAERYLERCLVSLLQQDMSSDEYEIIVINDGSTDKTENILYSYSTRYSNLIYVTVENRGVSEARNYGCQKAIGKYFLFVDADDWIQDNVLCKIYEALEKDNLDILVMDYHHWGDSGELPKEFGHIPDSIKADSKISSGTDFMQKYMPRAVWGNAYRMDFWKEHTFSFLPIRHEDEELIPRVFYYAARVKFLPVTFYYYYRNSDSFMMNYYGQACFSMLQAMESLNAFRQKYIDDKDLDLFLKNLIAKRLLTAFRKGISFGAPKSVQREMIKKMKAKGLTPLSQEKRGIREIMYRYFPDMFIFYYRIKTRMK